MKTKSNIAKELAALRKMSPAELRERYAELYGEPSRSGNISRDSRCVRFDSAFFVSPSPTRPA
jgi:hypothetical protein